MTQDVGLSGQSLPFDPLFLGQNRTQSADSLGGYDQYCAQTQPNDLMIMATSYGPHSLDFSIKDCTVSGGPSSSPSDSSLAPPSVPKHSLSVSPKSMDTDTARVMKRTRNTLAARRYRQRRVDQMSDLEAVLKETQTERDALKVRVARLEGELEALRGLARQ